MLTDLPLVFSGLTLSPHISPRSVARGGKCPGVRRKASSGKPRSTQWLSLRGGHDMADDDEKVVYEVRDGQIALIAEDDRVLVIEPQHRLGEPMACVEALVMACAHRLRDDEGFVDEMLNWFSKRLNAESKH